MIPFLVGGALIKILIDTNKSMKLDEQAQKKYAKAYEREREARALIYEKSSQANNSLLKVANRKRAILSTSMNDFLELYEKIIKINFVPGDGILELENSVLAPSRLSEIRNVTNTAISPMTDKEIVRSFLLKGIGGAMIDDSKRTLEMASNQLKASNVAYSQAETAAVIFNGIIERSNKFATLLSKMDLFFSRSIKTSSEIIEKNGKDRSGYNIRDRETLMTCINFADAIKKVIDAPLLNESGEIAEASIAAIQTGNAYLDKLKNI